MPHPFEVGKTYRNRAGEYVVLSIEGDQMKLRYVSGGTLTTDVNMQARIWENIQFEEQVSRAEERRRMAQEARVAARTRTRQAKAKPGFGGFQETDFQPKKRGISWPSRKELGKALAYELSHRTKRAFDVWPVPRHAVVHLARKEQYDAERPDRNVAFFVAVHERGLSYGLYVGKPDGAVEPAWPWSTWMAALAGNEAVREALREAMATQHLNLDVYAMQGSYGLVARVTVQGSALQWQQETAQQGIARPMEWAELVAALQAVAPDKRCEIQVCGLIGAEEAVQAGGAVVAAMMPVFEALLPAYQAAH